VTFSRHLFHQSGASWTDLSDPTWVHGKLRSRSSLWI